MCLLVLKSFVFRFYNVMLFFFFFFLQSVTVKGRVNLVSINLSSNGLVWFLNDVSQMLVMCLCILVCG